jgi:hypothetical protein
MSLHACSIKDLKPADEASGLRIEIYLPTCVSFYADFENKVAKKIVASYRCLY